MIVALAIAVAFSCAHPRVGDGDSLRCGRTRVRLAGIDAPELHGCHGRPGRRCVAGDGQRARRDLIRIIAGRPLRCAPSGHSYDRVTAWCALPDGRDLSCAAIAAGVAVRWARYDPAGRLTGC